MRLKYALPVTLLAALGALFLRVGGGSPASAMERAPVRELDLSSYSDAKPAEPLRLLFIHHSCGGQLLADQGVEVARANCIYDSHPNGGGLRRALVAKGYQVHEASYGSEVGDHTDMFDWLPKFQNQMEAVLATDENDRRLVDARRNQIVVFKSCFTQSDYVGEGTPPGEPRGPELTVENAKATLRALLPEFQRRPGVLFVYVTAPPLAGDARGEPVWHLLARAARGRPSSKTELARKGALAREVNNWSKAADGWLAGYPEKNVVVFDYFDVLTDSGRSNVSRFPSGDRSDSHPSSEGNARVVRGFVTLLNRAVRRAGLSP